MEERPTPKMSPTLKKDERNADQKPKLDVTLVQKPESAQKLDDVCKDSYESLKLADNESQNPEDPSNPMRPVKPLQSEATENYFFDDVGSCSGTSKQEFSFLAKDKPRRFEKCLEDENTSRTPNLTRTDDLKQRPGDRLRPTTPNL